MRWDAGWFEALLIFFLGKTCSETGEFLGMPVGLRNLGAECWLLPGVIVFMLASFRPSPRLVSKTKYDEAYCNLETISTIQFLLSRRKQIKAHTFSYEDGLVDSIIKSAGILGLYPITFP